ncbi:Glycine cleavage system H protein [hydrothermal vent metagenome]|uniref:Glycine cleavage system H protein n=1 Tax=hydrothermal vent metagenome TaxID=652676 RepID=A0A3B1BUW3_9ZZZZ
MARIEFGTKEECRWELPDELYYHKQDHIWARQDGGRVYFGVDHFGQYAAGEIQYLKIMPVGRSFKKNKTFGSLESGKYIGPMRAPAGGAIVEVNEAVIKEPKLINDSPYDNWVICIEPEQFDADIEGLPHGEDSIRVWMQEELDDYKSKELLECD